MKLYLQVIFILLALVFSTLSKPAFADRWSFSRFQQNDSNLPNSYERLRNIFSEVEARRIDAFKIYGGECKTSSYADGSGRGDCSYGSVRSMLREVGPQGRYNFQQPDAAWYSWDMQIPSEFPTYTQQTGGGYIFVQWKGVDCPHASIAHNSRSGSGNQLILRLQKTTGLHDCEAVSEINLMSMSDFKGTWRHFEVFVRWSNESDGQIRVFIDGRERGQYNGPTLDPNVRIPSGELSPPNHFDYGVYLCCTKGVQFVNPGTVYFANVKRAKSRN